MTALIILVVVVLCFGLISWGMNPNCERHNPRGWCRNCDQRRNR